VRRAGFPVASRFYSCAPPGLPPATAPLSPLPQGGSLQDALRKAWKGGQPQLLSVAQPVTDALLSAALLSAHKRVATTVNRGPLDAATQRDALIELASAVDARTQRL